MALYSRSDGGVLDFAIQFSAEITANAVPLGFSTAQASSLATLVTDYHAAYDLAKAATTRTRGAIEAKDLSKKLLMQTLKQYVGFVRSNMSVTNAQLADLGLPPRASRTPEPVPDESPVMTVLGVDGWTVKTRIKSSNPARRGRPPLTSGTTVVSYVGPTPPADVSGWKFEGNTGKRVVGINFDSSLPPGTKVWLSAFFFNGSKQSGPACTPVSTLLQGGGLVIGAADADHDNAVDAPLAMAA